MQQSNNQYDSVSDSVSNSVSDSVLVKPIHPDVVVIVRECMLAEVYCAYLIESNYPSGLIIKTRAVTELPDSVVSSLHGRDVIIYGGYYRNSIENISKVTRTITCIVQEDEEEWPRCQNLTLIRSAPCNWTLLELGNNPWENQVDPVHRTEVARTVSEYLDSYLYGYPSEEALNFQNGVYLLDGENDYEKIKRVGSMATVQFCLREGEKKRRENKRMADQRVAKGVLSLRNIDGRDIDIMWSEGDSPIVDTCLGLANESPSGVGILVRHDYKLKRTYISVCALKSSGMKASRIASRLIGGGGSPFMGGGSCEGLCFPHLV